MSQSTELTEALSYLTVAQPFFASLIYDGMIIIETENFNGFEVKTAATDGKHLLVNPKWFNALTLEERKFVLAHEVCHYMFQHITRAKGYGDRGVGPDLKTFNFKKWNRAGDYIINRWLSDIKLGTMPMQGLYHPDIDADALCDDVYLSLPDEDDDGNDPGHDQHMPPAPDAASPGEVKRTVAGAAESAKAMGKAPAGMDRIVGEIIEPKIPWSDHLRNAVTACIGTTEQTWSRPNRRRLVMSPHVYMPGRQGHSAGTIVVQIDTSGSVLETEMAAFRANAASILSECNPERLIVLWVDSAVAGVDEPDAAEELEQLIPKGGGGTDMRVGIDWCTNNDIRPDTFICLTDGGTPWPDKEPHFPTIWVITAKGTTSPIGKSIYLDI